MPLRLALRKKRARQRLSTTGTTRRAPALRSDTIKIDAPEIFSFAQNFDSVATFLHILRTEASAAGNRPLLVEMKHIRTLAPAAALSLVAELERWQRMKRVLLRPSTVPDWDPTVLAHLTSMGFFSLLGTPGQRQRPAAPPGKRLEYWLPFTSGSTTEGALAKRLRGRLERHIGSFSPELKAALYRPLIEAMKNSAEHAYPDGEYSDAVLRMLGRRWWMFGVAEAGERKIKVIFLDQGITIPASLPKSWMWQTIAAIIQNLGDDDSQRIVTAAAYGRSRHAGQKHRGKGLHNIVELASQHPENRLRIISRHGYCTVQGNGAMQRQNRAEGLNGTLIEWDLNLP